MIQQNYLPSTYLVINLEVVFPESRGRQGFKITSINSFIVQSSWKSLTSTCEIIVARQLYYAKWITNGIVKVGDPIILRAGYNGEFNEEFNGVVSVVVNDMPIKLICEDNMYLLKRVSAPNGTYKEQKLESFLKKILPSTIKIDAMDRNVPTVVIANNTVAEILQLLKDKAGIYSYFVGDTLESGKVFTDNTENDVVKYMFNVNVVTHDLQRKNKEDIKIRVKMTHTKPNGTKTIVVVGDKGGQLIELSCGESDKEKMKTVAQEAIDKLKKNGFAGSITGFGYPFAKHGYTAVIKDNLIPERDGQWYIDSVTASLSPTGAYRRTITLGQEAAEQKVF